MLSIFSRRYCSNVPEGRRSSASLCDCTVGQWCWWGYWVVLGPSHVPIMQVPWWPCTPDLVQKSPSQSPPSTDSKLCWCSQSCISACLPTCCNSPRLHQFLKSYFLLAQSLQTGSGPCRPAKFSAIQSAVTYLPTKPEPQPWGQTPLPSLSFLCTCPSPRVPCKFPLISYSFTLIIV